ncbi:unnamed protein product [Calicophoron daubneyi]|uniref:Ion transport domain-containing protein n=1 Tax=Calicophoron daubneyi TaxID=300641 RepID=A0AAV2TSA0_CALDB
MSGCANVCTDSTEESLLDDFKDAEDLAGRQARVLIEDAEYHHSILHRLDKSGIWLYRASTSKIAYFSHQVAILVLFMLPFFEWPSSLITSADVRIKIDRPRLPCGVTETVELLCLAVLITETVCSSISFGYSSVRKNPWLIGRYVCFVVYIVDLLVSISMSCNEFVRIRRFLRPYFLISSSQLMKKLLKCVKRTLPKLLSALFLLLFWIVSAALVAMCVLSNPPVFPSSNTTETFSSFFFPNLYVGLYELLVALTTANHPDVILETMRPYRIAGLFSVVYLGIGIYVILNIITAIVYSEFRGYLLSSVQSRLLRRRVATRAAFEALKKLDSDGLEYAASDDVIQLIDTVSISSWKKEVLREAYVVQFAESNLTAAQFLQLFKILDLSAPYREAPGLRPISPGFARSFHAFITSSLFTKLSFFVGILNIIHLSVDLDDQVTHPGTVRTKYRIINWCFVTFYVAEQVLLTWAIGPRRYFTKLYNIWSFTVVFILLVTKLVEVGYLLTDDAGHIMILTHLTLWDVIRITNILLLLRSVRVVNMFTWARLVAGVLLDLPRSLLPALGILASAYYLYALLGIALFHGKIIYNATEIYSNAQNYQKLGYWPINFDDFAGSLFVLWCLMIVNNWFVFVDAYQQAVGYVAHIYFVSWWVITVLGLLSLVTAFVIETFVYRRDLYAEASKLSNAPRDVTMINGLYVTTPVTDQNSSSASLSRSTFSSKVYVGHSQSLFRSSDGSLLAPPHLISSGSHPSSPIVVYPIQITDPAPIDLISPYSLDDLFRSALREPTEEELMTEVIKHPMFQRVSIQNHASGLMGNNVPCS